tara:strand:+ start:2830 stop:4401 length:1572 start_codon:yes stop_codon:yes gene_type:complete
MSRYLFLSLLITFQFLNAQDSPSGQSSTSTEDETLDADQFKILLDSIDNQDPDLQRMAVKGKEGKVHYELLDEAAAARFDSIWMSRLMAEDLFDSITNMVQSLDYNSKEALMVPTDTLKKRLAILDAKTPFNIEYNTSLESVINMYLRRHKPTMERLMGLTEFYFPTFEQALDKKNMPLELKYLSIVESAMRPRAKSPVGATGIWQFMFPTAKLYGLDVSSYVDERMDPLRSTEAATSYLTTLYDVFEDWDLALAAYNSGPGNVTKAMRRSGSQNYWNLRRYLPRETAGYLPAFLATLYIFEYANEHGYKPKKPEYNYFQTDTVHVKSMITLEQVSKYTGVDIEQLQFLNPSYKMDIIPFVEDKKYALRLPKQAMGKFVTNEDAIYQVTSEELKRKEATLPQYVETPERIVYRVKNGDYLGKVASKYGVGVSQLKRWNNLRSTNLKIGQRLVIYPTRPVASASSGSRNNQAGSSGNKTYVVQSGDSLWTIAKKFPGVTTKNLQVWNDISGTSLKPGQTLVVSK